MQCLRFYSLPSILVLALAAGAQYSDRHVSLKLLYVPGLGCKVLCSHKYIKDNCKYLADIASQDLSLCELVSQCEDIQRTSSDLVPSNSRPTGGRL